MKKIFYLFAATALFGACTSDTLEDESVNGSTPSTEPVSEYVTASTVGFTNGTEVSVRSLSNSEEPATRTASWYDGVDFELPISNEILQGFDDYVIKADDFAIRVDGEFLSGVKPVEDDVNTVCHQGILISEQDESWGCWWNGFKISVNNLQNLDFSEVHDYTFEVYVWIENKKLLNDGSGSFGELFTDLNKFTWIGQQDKYSSYNSVAEGEKYKALLKADPKIITGVDASKEVFDACLAGHHEYFNTKKGGYLVRYNVFRGLNGHNGDTPYIKVSISVEKQEQTTVGEKGNDCTFVDYTSKDAE